MVNHTQDFVAIKKYEILQYSLIPSTEPQHEEHKQDLKLFSIFTKQARPELKGRRRTKARSDSRNPPNFKFIKISDHFIPKPASVRPDDPGTEGEPSAGESC